MSQELSIIIPAAGMGKRMKSYGPKPLIELNDRYNVIGWQLQVLRKAYPSAEIIVVVGHEADSIMKSGVTNVKFVENETYETTNVVRSIGMGLRIASHPNVLIVYGDLVFNLPATHIVEDKSVTVVDNRNQFSEEEVGVTVVDGRITRLSYDLPTKWGQIIYLTGRELELFKKVAWDRDHAKWFGFEAINVVLSNGGVIRAIEPPLMRIAEIDTSKDIEKARNILS